MVTRVFRQNLLFCWTPLILAAGWAIVPVTNAQSVEVRPESTDASYYGSPRRIAKLVNDEVDESSGLAVSRRQSGVFWTHNDSGDAPRIFSFDATGQHLSVCRLLGADAVDWEDMCSFNRAGKDWLLLADVGDNGKRRKAYELYLCEEPTGSAAYAETHRINFRYDRGSHDCESVAVDPVQGVVLLVTKVVGPSCQVFQLAIPKEPTSELLVAQPIGNIAIPLAVAMDVSPDGLRAAVLTYGDAMEFSREKNETWQQGFARSPRRISMPGRRQGESICYGGDGRSLYLTCESRQSPLWEVPWIGAPSETASKQGN